MAIGGIDVFLVLQILQCGVFRVRGRHELLAAIQVLQQPWRDLRAVLIVAIVEDDAGPARGGGERQCRQIVERIGLAMDYPLAQTGACAHLEALFVVAANAGVPFEVGGQRPLVVRDVGGAVLELDQRVIGGIEVVRATDAERRYVARSAVGIADRGGSRGRVVEVGIIVMHLVIGSARVAEAVVQHRLLQLVLAPDHEDLVVNGFLLVAQGLVEAIDAQAIDKAVGRCGRGAVRCHRQTLAQYRFGIAGVEAADVIAIVCIRLVAQVDADTVTAAVILVPALVPAGIGQRRMHAIVEKGRFDIVDAALVFIVGGRDDDREGVIRIGTDAGLLATVAAEAGAGGQ